ncbi:metallophosphoesterase family protein [Desulfovibrio ferrophilus]|uniref:Metallophosphoesterase n=1 Tax=Desulfovibrio ferrophilus TaxID=241368 RepID=A0A2Z6B0H2_9BACT|nr:DNA repair exonuclease [Desulfovibrio ferrophilus]BBD09001.1 metallophosphoesterase [Desulfovibrio ferrophilus]
MIRFLHAADIHLDSPLVGLSRYEGAPVDEVRSATRRALVRLVDTAIEHAVPLMLIAGDAYDGDWKDFQTGLFFAAQMSRLNQAGIRVIMVRGNHDAASVMTRSLPLPENVTILSAKRPETIDFPELGIAVHGQSFATRDVSENLVPAYPAPLPDRFNIGLLHTAVSGNHGSAPPYAPCRLEELVAKGYQYWALGHVHNYKKLHEEPAVIYTGCIQGRHAREPGPKGCVLVSVNEAETVETEFLPLAVMRWEQVEVDAIAAVNRHEVGDLFAEALRAALAQAGELPLAVRVLVVGRTAAHAALAADPERTVNELRALAEDVSAGRAWVEKVKLQTASPLDVEALRDSDTPQGDLLRSLERLAQGPEELAELGLDLTDIEAKLRAVPGSGVTLPDLEDQAAMAALLDDVRELVLPLLDVKETGEGNQ